MAPVELSQSAARARMAPEEAEDKGEVRQDAEVQAEPAEDTGPVPVRAAFLVLVGLDGSYRVEGDINAPVVPERPPHADEIRAACQVVAGDIFGQQVVLGTVQSVMHGMGQIPGAVVQSIAQAQRQAMEQQQNQQILDAASKGAGLPQAFRGKGK